MLRDIGGLRTRADGAVAVVFAIIVVATVAVAGIAVDFIYATKMRQSLQDALDAGLLAAVAGGALTEAELATTVPKYFTVNWDGKYPDMPAQISYDVSTKTITAEAHIDVPTTLTRIMGFDSLSVNVESETNFAQNSYEVAMVLDTTNSEAGSVFTSLQNSAISLVDTISSHVGSGTAKFAIIPFSQFVRLPTSYKDATWLNYTSTTPSAWTGCVGYRSYPYDSSDGNLSVKIPARDSTGQCADELLPLTDSVSTVEAKIKGLKLYGLTYGPSGIIWGMRALSSSDPLTEAAPDGTANLKKILIYMTDGVNNVNPYISYDHVNSYKSTSEQCTNAKASGIIIYTVLYSTSNTEAESTIKACASAESNYFAPANTTSLASAFDEIATDILNIYLSK